MNIAVTQWLHGDLKPQRPGVYETRDWTLYGWSYWTGSAWCLQRDNRDDAAADAEVQPLSRWQGKDWRGVDLTRLEQAIETLVCLGKWDDDIERDEPFTWTVERQAELIQRAIDADFDNKKPAGQGGPNGNSAHE